MPGTNRINFSHLDAGNHTLYVRACQNGSYSSVKRYSIHVAAPWYASTLALIIYLFIIAGALYATFSYYNRRRRDELNEMKLQFFTNISHEIRSPMTMIISPLDKLLKETSLDPALRQPLQIMYRNANRILSLVNQLLDIRKIDKGQMKLQCCETDMVPFLQDIYELFSTQAASHHITFTYVHQMDELIAWIDRNSIDKVVINLLSNAFKYTQAGGEISLELSLGTDPHVDGPLHHYFQVCVADTGIGLNDNETSRIFERFYRSRNSLSTSGTGIGLHLCQALVRTHRGTINAANRADRRGSLFTFRLPLGKAHLKPDEIVDSDSIHRLVLTDETEVQTVENAPQTRLAHNKTGFKLLVIDDDEDIMEFLRTELSSEYKVITCGNGKEGLQLALSQNPALIISDVMMPEMDGYTFVKLLKNNANISHIPVILLSAKSELHDRVEGLGRGADAYLAKPFHIDELTTLVHNLITNRQRLIGKFSGQQDQTERVENVEMQSSDEALMDRIMKVVNANISNSDFNIEELASEVGLSRTHLHRKLKELTGISASEFIRNIRFKQAAMLLREKRMNISQIAYAVGFSNQTHFSTSFKKFYGISPSEYIEKSESEETSAPKLEE
jgi:signal transduction histidine kinase/DNA-binding response OmpR family regulator